LETSNSQIFVEVIHILDIVQKYLKLSTKIYHMSTKKILYYVPKYILYQVLKLLTKIFLQNMGTKKALSNND